MQENNPFRYLRRLTEGDLPRLEAFDCEDDRMNEFLTRFAIREQVRRLNHTYLVASPPDPCPGFVTISAAQVAREFTGMSKGELPYPVAPAVFIGRMAVDHRYKRRGVGRALLRSIRWMGFTLPLGCRFVALQVHESNVPAMTLYESEGFWVPPGYEPQKGLLLMLYDLATARPATEASPIDYFR